MKRSRLLVGLTIVGLGAAALAWSGVWPKLMGMVAARKTVAEPFAPPLPPAISVVQVAVANFVETIVVPGTLVAREEVLIAPEVEGLRVVDVRVDEGRSVRKGDTLAVLETATLAAQLAQNDAALARNDAAIAQALSSITQAEARLEEAANAFARAKPLRQSGTVSEATYDQREAAARTAQAQLAAARDGLKVAEAEKAQTNAIRKDIIWKQSRTEIKAPLDGIVARRNARIGAMASAAGEPMFRLIANAEVELDAEIPELHLARLKPGQKVTIAIAGLAEQSGTVRIVSPEIDRTSRLGRVRILLDTMSEPRVGSFGKATVTTATSRGLAVPASAVQFGVDSATVQLVEGQKITTRKIKPGLQSGDLVEVREGLAENDVVVARAGTFLREGDVIRPVPITADKVSEVK